MVHYPIRRVRSSGRAHLPGFTGLLLRFSKALSFIMIVISFAMDEVNSQVDVTPWFCSYGGLNPEQEKMCLEMPQTISTIQDTYSIFAKECTNQFENERWNCSGLEAPMIGETPPELKRATKETAFVYSLTSASLAYAITKACTEGAIPQCGCDDSLAGVPYDDWVWGSCSDDVQFGINYAQKFLDSRHSEGTENKTTKELGVALVGLHNNAVGRMVVQDNVEVHCTCHGVSGSCSVKTCWRQQAEIRTVSDDLRHKFDQAVKVAVLETNNAPLALKSVKDEDVQPSSEILVYTKKTQDFCTSSSSYTNGRECVPRELVQMSQNGTTLPGGAINLDAPICEDLCCHKKYTMKRSVKTTNCNCVFEWCCHILCEVCAQTIDMYYCDGS